MMKKQVLQRGIIGAVAGIAISHFIALIISAAVGGGNFVAAAPALVQQCGGELRAVVLQTLCSMLYGAVWAASSLIWEVERWSPLRMTVTHFAVCSVATLPIAYFMQWMEHTPGGFAAYFAIFLAIYASVWLGCFFATKKRLAQLNQKLGSEE